MFGPFKYPTTVVRSSDTHCPIQTWWISSLENYVNPKFKLFGLLQKLKILTKNIWEMCFDPWSYGRSNAWAGHLSGSGSWRKHRRRWSHGGSRGQVSRFTEQHFLDSMKNKNSEALKSIFGKKSFCAEQMNPLGSKSKYFNKNNLKFFIFILITFGLTDTPFLCRVPVLPEIFGQN